MKNLPKVTGDMLLTSIGFVVMGILVTLVFKYHDQMGLILDEWIKQRQIRM